MSRRLAMHLLLALSLVASGLASAVHVAAHPAFGIVGLSGTGAGPVEARHLDEAHHTHGTREAHEAHGNHNALGTPGDVDDADVSCLGYHLFAGTSGGLVAPPGLPCALRGGAPAGGTAEAGVHVGGPSLATIRGPPRVS